MATRSTERAAEEPASRLIDERIRELAGWRGETLARVRALILRADPEIAEEWKWANPVWSRGGIVCTGEAYSKVVKLTFPRGAKTPDPAKLFNSSLEGNARRAIDIREGEELDARAFQALVRAAVAQNAPAKGASSPSPARKSAGAAQSAPKTAPKTAKRGAKSKSAGNESEPRRTRKSEAVVLLSGGNPQIAKGDGDAPVQAYIAAMPGWKRELGVRLDALVTRHAPGVRKAVKWNSPFYGIEGQGWFLSFHVFTRYVKLTFFRGAALRPVPPGGTERSKDARWIDLFEDDALDEAQLAKWVKQAAALPGWIAGKT